MVMMTPEGFLKDPMSWLRACSEFGCTITASPNFGFEMALRRFAGAPLDLSRLRICITGAEPISPHALRAFNDVFSPSGFPSVAFSPAYGMAESGLAVTLVDPADHWESVRLDSSALANGDLRISQDGTEVVSSGRAVAGAMVHTVLGEGNIGEVVIGGSSMGAAYADGS